MLGHRMHACTRCSAAVLQKPAQACKPRSAINIYKRETLDTFYNSYPPFVCLHCAPAEPSLICSMGCRA
jgi:hypothetical protein